MNIIFEGENTLKIEGAQNPKETYVIVQAIMNGMNWALVSNQYNVSDNSWTFTYTRTQPRPFDPSQVIHPGIHPDIV